MEATDKVLHTAQNKFGVAYGAGAGALPWMQILQAIMSVLTGCVNPTPANLKAQADRPLIRLKLHRRLVQAGIPVAKVPGVMDAFIKVLKEGTDEEINTFVEAALESE